MKRPSEPLDKSILQIEFLGVLLNRSVCIDAEALQLDPA